MADNASFAADEIGGVLYPRVKMSVGPDGSATDLNGSADRGVYVDPRLKVVRLQQTPTISTAIYAAKDAVGGLLTFANAVRASGGSGRIIGATISDLGQQMPAVDLVLFDRTFTASADNAVFAPTDPHALNVVGVIEFAAGDWHDFSTVSVASWPQTTANPGLPFVLAGTDLFGQLVARGTPTPVSTSDLTVTLTISQD